MSRISNSPPQVVSQPPAPPNRSAVNREAGGGKDEPQKVIRSGLPTPPPLVPPKAAGSKDSQKAELRSAYEAAEKSKESERSTSAKQTGYETKPSPASGRYVNTTA
jgi:hypothetical protein